MKEPSQRGAASRHDAGGGLVVAAAVGVPDGVLIGSRDLPGNLVAAGRLLRADRRPRTRLTRHEGRTEKAQLRARRSTDRIQYIIIRRLKQAGRSSCPELRRVAAARSCSTEQPVETRKGELQRRAASRHDAG